jgi:hypothetical protein
LVLAFLLGEDKSSLLKPKFEYILSFAAALLAYKSLKALIYTSAEVLATRGSLALLVSILSTNSNAKVATILRSKRLVIILSLLHKN